MLRTKGTAREETAEQYVWTLLIIIANFLFVAYLFFSIWNLEMQKLLLISSTESCQSLNKTVTISST